MTKFVDNATTITADWLNKVDNKLGEFISVREFGAVGDGVADDTIAFFNADAYASSTGATLVIDKPAVAYLGNGFKPTTDWYCEPGTIFLNSNRAARNATAYSFFVVEHDVRIENVIADANRINTVTGTADITSGGWTSGNYDAFTGGIAIVIQNGAKPTMINCTGRNSGGHPVWHITNSSPKLYRCKANGGRGNFGDGFYLGTCTNAVLEDCESTDVTRINFVSESKSIGTCFMRPVARNAHDYGNKYGGTEFNASIWMEHTVGSVIRDADCDGIIQTGGASLWVGDPRANEPLLIDGGRSTSLQLSSAAADVFDLIVRGHKTGQVTFSMLGATQTTTLDGVHVVGGGASTANLNGAIRCDGEVASTYLRVVNSTLQMAGAIDTASHGHIAFNTKMPHITVENTKGFDSSGNEVPLTMGFLSAAVVTTGSLKVRNADVTLWGNIYCGAVSLDGRYSLTCDSNVNLVAPLFLGPNGVVKTSNVANTNRLFIYKDITARCKFQNVRLRMIGDASKSIADFRGASFEYDMNMFTGVMQFSEANWNHVNLSNTVFRNTNSVASANNFWIETAVTAPLWLVSGAYSSSTVTYSTKRNTSLEAITGFTPAAF